MQCGRDVATRLSDATSRLEPNNATTLIRSAYSRISKDCAGRNFVCRFILVWRKVYLPSVMRLKGCEYPVGRTRFAGAPLRGGFARRPAGEPARPASRWRASLLAASGE